MTMTLKEKIVLALLITFISFSIFTYHTVYTLQEIVLELTELQHEHLKSTRQNTEFISELHREVFPPFE